MHARHGRSLIVFAWAVELVGVVCGVVNSAYVTFGNNMPTTIPGWIPAVPLAALAASELLRVPLAGALVVKAGVMARGLAIIALIALAGIAIENWTFGLERIVNLRLGSVQEAEDEVFVGKGHVRSFVEQRNAIEKSKADIIGEKAASISRLRETSDRLAGQAKAALEEHESKLDRIFKNCRITTDKCVTPETTKENARFASQRKLIDDEQRRTTSNIEQLEKEIVAVTRDAEPRIADNEAKIQEAQTELVKRVERSQQAKEENQIYRLAGMWFGVKAGDVTPGQFNGVRSFFCLFGAIAIALAGTISALVFYSRDKVPGGREPWQKASNAARAYFARRRKRVVREVEVEKQVDRIVEVPGPERIVYRDGKEPAIIVEKEKIVDRPVEHIVLVPRFGIGWPVHINSLLGRGLTNGHALGAETPGNTASVQTIKKAS
jgi:hypothetical protein